MAEPDEDQEPAHEPVRDRGKTVHGNAANAGHRVLAPDDAEVEAYLEVALDAPAPDRAPDDRPIYCVQVLESVSPACLSASRIWSRWF